MGGSTSRSDELSETLLKAATPDIYAKNSFRIIGLPTDAKSSVIKRQIDKAGMLLKLSGDGAWRPGGALPLDGQVSVETLGKVKRRLNDPEQRLVDECFWFWPTGEGSDNTVLDALSCYDIKEAVEIWCNDSKSVAARHNLAVLYHCLALEGASHNTPQLAGGNGTWGDDLWGRALKLWSGLNSSEDFWDYLGKRVRELDDPRLNEDTLRRFRLTLPLAILHINAHLLSTDMPTIGAGQLEHTDLIVNSGFSSVEVKETLRVTARMVEERIRILCRQAEAESQSTPARADRTVRKLIETVNRLLPVLDRIQENRGRVETTVLRDDVATCALDCLIKFGNGSRDWTTENELLQSLMTVAKSDIIVSRIGTEIETIRTNVLGQTAERERAKMRELRAYIESFTSKVDVIISSRVSALAKFYQLRDRLVPELAIIRAEKGQASHAFDEISNMFSRSLMNVALELNKAGGKPEFAQEAIGLSAEICLNPDLRRQVEQNARAINISLYTTPIRSLCEKAKVNALDSAEHADEVVRWLLVNTRPHLAQVDSILRDKDPTRIAIHDEVALAALECHHHYGRKTMNMAVCLELLELIRPIAVRESTRGRIADELDFARRFVAAQDADSKKGSDSKKERPVENTDRSGGGDSNTEGSSETKGSSRKTTPGVRYPVRDSLKSLTSRIKVIVEAPEPATQKFYELLDRVLPVVRTLNSGADREGELARDAADMAAEALRAIGGELYKSTETRALGREALNLAAKTCASLVLKREIERENEELTRYADEMEFFVKDLGPVKGFLGVKSVAGTGTWLRSQSDFDSKHLSHLATLYLMLLFLPTFPLGRYRVIKRRDGTYKFLGRSTLRVGDKLHLTVAIILIAGLISLLLFY